MHLRIKKQRNRLPKNVILGFIKLILILNVWAIILNSKIFSVLVCDEHFSALPLISVHAIISA